MPEDRRSTVKFPVARGDVRVSELPPPAREDTPPKSSKPPASQAPASMRPAFPSYIEPEWVD